MNNKFDIIHHEVRGNKLQGTYEGYQTVKNNDLRKYTASEKKRKFQAFYEISKGMICV